MEFITDERTIQERFCERFETFYAYYLSMVEQYHWHIDNGLDIEKSNKIRTLGYELKELAHDLKQSI